jgi:hypothetical protein
MSVNSFIKLMDNPDAYKNSKAISSQQFVPTMRSSNQKFERSGTQKPVITEKKKLDYTRVQLSAKPEGGIIFNNLFLILCRPCFFAKLI